MTRVLIADDHEVVRDGVRAFLERHANYLVVAEAADGEEAIAKTIDTEPDVALLDYSLPLLNGLEVTLQIRARLPRTEVLIFTVCESELVIEEALKADARGYLLKIRRKSLSARCHRCRRGPSAVLHEQGHGNFVEALSGQT